MTAQEALQARIDAQQTFDKIDYALRSIRTCGGETRCAGAVHSLQLMDGCKAGAELLGRNSIVLDGSTATFWLRQAKRQAAEALKEAKAAMKGYGGRRQLRLALAA